MANYYFLAPSLPSLVLGEKPDLSFDELATRLTINLTKKDQKKVEVMRRYFDLSNLRALFLEDSIDLRGNLSEKELDEALLIKADLPQYAFDFLERFENAAEKLRFFPGLLAAYFHEEEMKCKGFLKTYLNWERDWRVVILTLRAKKLGRDVIQELQFEDSKDPLVVDILAQKESTSYTPPVDYVGLKELYQAAGPDPWQQYEGLAQWRMQKIEEIVQQPLFSIDWILSYMARLWIIEQHYELDSEKGKMILEAFIG